jgi:cytochrome c nitrite reductase small subunit
MARTVRNWLGYLAVAAVIAAAGGFFVMFGPPGLMAKTETPDFCASCHVMESQYEAWFHAGAHRSLKCVDCHLPHGNLATYYTWKSIDGMKDVVVFYSGRVPENITASSHARKTIQGNCIRCHTERVFKIDTQRNCWDCHRQLQHRLTGIRQTI